MDQVEEYAEYILECSKQDPSSIYKSSNLSKVKSLDQRLLDMYMEESAKLEEDKKLDTASHLLGKLMRRERLNCLVLSLFPNNEGYSLMLRARSGVESETMKLPYEESEVLEYIDAAELPPFLLDLLDKAQVNIFYSGCVIVEVRDYRCTSPGCYDTQHVLLRPSSQSLLSDVSSLGAEFGGGSWSQDDLHQLEGELLLNVSEPLCLDPSPAVAMVATELTRQQRMFNEPSLKRSMKRHSQVALNRKKKMAQAPAPKELRLLDFLHKKRDKSKVAMKPVKSVDTWKQKSTTLIVPQDFESPESLFKVVKDPVSTEDDNLILAEEYRLERDPFQEPRMLAVISIYRQRHADGFMGRLYLHHAYTPSVEADPSQQGLGCSCLFPLGVRRNVDRYVDQFRDLFTEEGRRLVRITTKISGQPEEIVLTHSQGTTPLPAGAAATAVAVATPVTVAPTTITAAHTLFKQATSVAASIATQQGEAGTASLAAKRNIPIQLSLSITPVSGAPSIIPVSVTNHAPGSMTVQSSQSQASSQRLKQLSLHQRTTPSPMASPASTPTSTPQHFTASIVHQPPSLQKVPTPTPTPTPPPNSLTPTPSQLPAPSFPPTSLSSRRSSAATLESVANMQGSQLTMQPTQNIGFVTQDQVAAGSVSQGQGTQLSNINIASLGSLPPNLNLQNLNLSGVSLANLGLQGLQGMQVSLSMPGGIVPVPITMINTSPSLLHNQTGILTSSSGTGSSPAALVTMVTALPASTVSTTSGSSTTGTMSSQQVVMSTGMGTGQTAVLPSNSGMLSLPVGLSGLTQLMPVTTKAPGNVGLRTPASLPLIQLPGGQQSIQLLSLQQQQRGGQLKTGTLTAAITSTPQPPGAINRQATSTPVPLSTVLTSQQMSALTSLTMGKAGAAGGPTLPNQFIHLTAGAQGQGIPVPSHQAGVQTLHTQLAFQKPGGGGGSGAAPQTLHFHQLQLKQPGQPPTLAPALAPSPASMPASMSASMSASASAMSKPKSKKRGGATPPKSL